MPKAVVHVLKTYAQYSNLHKRYFFVKTWIPRPLKFIVFIIYILLKEALAYFWNSFYLNQCYGLIQHELKHYIWIYNASFTVRGKREGRKIAVKCHWIPCLLFAIYILFVKASGADWVRCCRRYGRHCGAREPTWGAEGKFFKIKIKNFFNQRAVKKTVFRILFTVYRKIVYSTVDFSNCM